MLTGLLFLQINGYKFKIKDEEALYDISLNLANKKMSEHELVDYITKNTLIDFEFMSYMWNELNRN